jgi:hypothetical protein
MQTSLYAEVELLSNSSIHCRVPCRVADAAKDWLTPAPRVAEEGSMGTKLDGLPEHPPGPQEQQAISHKCDTAGCVTKRHLEFYNWTRENSLRA